TEAGIDQAGDEVAGVGGENLQQGGDDVDVDALGAVQAHRQRFFGGVGEVAAFFVRCRGFPGGGVPLSGQLVGDGPGVGAAGVAFACAPGGFGGGEALVVTFLGDVGVDPGEGVQRGVAAPRFVVEGGGGA